MVCTFVELNIVPHVTAVLESQWGAHPITSTESLLADCLLQDVVCMPAAAPRTNCLWAMDGCTMLNAGYKL